jgi:3-hydroxymyristoyl/3-hydroxydecanoyl-(acyl carrier protein) dehydratase
MAGAEFAEVIRKQMMNNEQAFRMFMDAQNKLYEQMVGSLPEIPVATPVAAPVAAPAKTKFPNASKTCLYNREQVVTMTDTSMAAVLGEKYKEVDKYPVRSRMPLPPFRFVSRIMSIDAEFGVFRPSSIVTEFDLDEDNVFRCNDRTISPLVASEASHVAIFLMGYMGLDAISQGTLSYRAIDSSMTAYSERPFRVGDTLRTVLKLERFVKNGSTTLVYFTFESYNGDELIFITEATGGFFTKADLASNKGIIAPKKQLRKNVEPKEFPHLSTSTKTSYNKEEMDAFYRADYETCFGVKPRASHKEIYYLPHDIKMVDRVTQIDYNGGIYGRGFISGEKQITPDMWPFKAHFKNDPVFPAIIVSDAVTQLGMFLFTHAGLLNKFPNPYFTNVMDNCIKSRFRGQTRHGYSTLRYEVSIKDLVEYEDHMDLFYDAKIFNDEVQIMQIDSYALRIRNAD